MNGMSDLRGSLLAVAKRSMGHMKACNNEESTKLYLVLPVIGLLGYDASDPLEVYPRHESDPVGKDGRIHRADFAILNQGKPVIAFGCVKAGLDATPKLDEISGYFQAWPSTRLGIVTNGIRFDFHVDSGEPGVMDHEPFLSLDLDTVAQSGATDEVLETLNYVTKSGFDAEMIAEVAHLQLVKKRLRNAFIEEAQAPSEEFCRAMLQRVGFQNVRKPAIDRHYAPLMKTAFEEALVLPVLHRLKGSPAGDGKINQASQRMATAERELAVFNRIRRRLAFLAQDEASFQAIDRVDYRDYVGKVVVYLDRDPRGRLFELILGLDGANKFIFPDPFGAIVTNNLLDIDEALKITFANRVRELEGQNAAPQKISRIA
jgi:hypothetical protein